jgi:alcohol dehydrogenase class IV
VKSTNANMKLPSETYRRAFPNEDVPHVTHGRPFSETCKKHVEETFRASHVYIIASRTLSSNTDALDRLKYALDDRVVGVRIGMTPHTLWSECLQVTDECRKLDVDLLITLGAGSLTDAAKIVSLVRSRVSPARFHSPYLTSIGSG